MGGERGVGGVVVGVKGVIREWSGRREGVVGMVVGVRGVVGSGMGGGYSLS